MKFGLAIVAGSGVAVASAKGSKDAGLEELFGDLGAMLGDMDNAGGRSQDAQDLMGALGGLFGGMDNRQRREDQGEIADEFAVCPRGKVPAPKKSWRKYLSVNGCGTAGFKIESPWGLEKCCNRHDLCYSTPGVPFEYCEKSFTDCMAQVCDTWQGKDKKECVKQADSFSSMTKMLGKGIYANSQKETTLCKKTALEARKAYKARVTELLAEHHPEEATEERVEALFEMVPEGGEGQLLYGLILDAVRRDPDDYEHLHFPEHSRKPLVRFDNVKEEL